MPDSIPVGQRKVRTASKHAMFLLVGLAVMFVGAWATGAQLKDLAAIWTAYVAGVVGNAGAYMWGNSQVAKADAPKEPTL